VELVVGEWCNEGVRTAQRRLTAVAGVVMVATAFALAQSGRAADPWTALERPLHLPTVAAGGACPVSHPGKVNFLRYGVGVGIGIGPAYPIGFAQPGTRLTWIAPATNNAFAGSQWGGEKVLWFVAPSYRGRVLIRGGRLDATGDVRFGNGVTPATEMRIGTGPAKAVEPGIKLVGQRVVPSVTRLQSPGCYAYQIDGTTFSRVIVFSAISAPA
jgi:hypothetical protein